MKLNPFMNNLKAWIFHFNSGCKQTLKYLNYPCGDFGQHCSAISLGTEWILMIHKHPVIC